MPELPELPNTRSDIFERIYNYPADVYHPQLFTPEKRTAVLNALLKAENGDDSEVDACLRMLCFARENGNQELIIAHLAAVASDTMEYNGYYINSQMANSSQSKTGEQTRSIDVLTKEEIPSDRAERLKILKAHFLKQDYQNWLVTFVNDPNVTDFEIQLEITRIYAVLDNAKQDTSFIVALLQGHPVESAAIPEQFKEIASLLMILLTAAEEKAAQVKTAQGTVKADKQFVEKTIWMENLLAAAVMTVAERNMFARFIQQITPASSTNNARLQWFLSEIRKMNTLVEKSIIKFSATLSTKSVADLFHIFIEQHELVKDCKKKMRGDKEEDFDARFDCAVAVQSIAALKPALAKAITDAKLSTGQYDALKKQIESNRDLLGEDYKFLRDLFAKLPVPEIRIDKGGDDDKPPYLGLRLDVL